MKNVWEILELEPTSNKRTIKKAYAKQLAKYHPEDYPEEFQMIQQAYQTIMDSLNRSYDEQKSMNTQLELQMHTHNEIILEDLKNQAQEDSEETGNSHQSVNSYFNEIPYYSQTQDDESFEKYLCEQMYQRFVERLKHEHDILTMHSLIMDDHFYDYMSNQTFYEKISKFLSSYINSFDDVVISFLYDVFSIIERDYQYEDHCVTNAIKKRKEAFIRKQRKEKKRAFVLCALIIIIALSFGGYFKGEQRQTQIYEEQRKQDNVRKAINDSMKISREKAQKYQTFVETKVQEDKQKVYHCSVTTLTAEANASYPFICTLGDDPAILTGTLFTDENADAKEIETH